MDKQPTIENVFITPRSKIQKHRGIVSAAHHFLIDVGRERVFCRHCGNLCKKIALKRFTMHWCGNLFCENTYEFRQSVDGVWRLHDYGGIIREPEMKAKIRELIYNSIDNNKQNNL